MSIVAALDKVLFFNASSKYSVLRMKTEDSSVPAEARSPYRYHDHLIRFTAVGIELPQTDTVKIEMDGEWKDGKYGLQLQVDHWQEIVPPTLEGVRNYLASGLLKGIGEKTADAIIEKFGINALEILEHQPDRLLEIRGITKERLAEIKDAYAETSRMRVLMTLLAPFKVTPTTAQKIYQHFGPACADIVRQSPFNLCQVPGFGFKRIDAIVQKSGGDLRDPKRVHGALFYALEDARTKDGHLYLHSPTECAYLAQKCGDGFVVRQFHVNRQYRKEENTITSKTSCFEKQRIFYRADLTSHPYYWGWYKQRRTRWVEGIDEYINTGMGYSYNEYCYQPGSIYGKTLSSIAPFLVRTGLSEYVRLCRGHVSPNWYLAAWESLPRIEQICKAGLSRLTVECMENVKAVKSCIRQESETSLVKALALDTHRLSRLRTLNGGAIMLDWLQREKCSGRIIPDHVLRWLEQEKIHVSDIAFILDRMSEQQVCNYLQRQKCGTRDSLRQIISTWRDYLSMADKLGINTHDEIVYRVKLLRQRHDELVEQLRKRERDMEAAATARKYRKIAGICRLIKPKYEYTGEVYSIVVPSGVRDIMREGDALSHCVGKSDRYWERIEQQEAYILFLRKTAEIDKPYYTLEVEPNGTIRQKRTYFDRQNDDLKDAEQFLKEWQKVVAKRLTESDREKAEKSKILRLQEFEQLRQDDIRIHIEASNDGCTLAAAYPYNPFLRKISPKKSAAMQSTAGS